MVVAGEIEPAFEIRYLARGFSRWFVNVTG